MKKTFQTFATKNTVLLGTLSNEIIFETYTFNATFRNYARRKQNRTLVQTGQKWRKINI